MPLNKYGHGWNDGYEDGIEEGYNKGYRFGFSAGADRANKSPVSTHPPQIDVICKSWDDAPKDALYAAVGCSCDQLYFFDAEPEIEYGDWDKIDLVSAWQLDAEVPLGIDWRQTLTERPERTD